MVHVFSIFKELSKQTWWPDFRIRWRQNKVWGDTAVSDHKPCPSWGPSASPINCCPVGMLSAAWSSSCWSKAPVLDFMLSIPKCKCWLKFSNTQHANSIGILDSSLTYDLYSFPSFSTYSISNNLITSYVGEKAATQSRQVTHTKSERQ